jgi:tagatose-6-phosphate ketose/aldose isomerase
MTDLTDIATWREIMAQPDIWAGWGSALPATEIRQWIKDLNVEEVWFCGAGTSAYIGEIVVAGLEGEPGPRLRAVPSTDLVSRPQAYLTGRKPLVVSFGRSGNSTESIGTLDALDALAPDAPRLHITCNPKGTLATRSAPGLQKVVLLPEATHDAGFAMTSSFSTMLLTALALFDRDCDVALRLAGLADQMRMVLADFAKLAHASKMPDRVVFLGAGPLAFAAREAALKVMELTAGQVPALWDSTLGFRHGPKSFVHRATEIVVFMSPEPLANRYDADLVAELRQQFPDAGVTPLTIDMPYGGAWGAPLAVAYAQVHAVVWSHRLGLNVDDPFSGQGTLSRVVSGVTLYPVTP